VSRSLAALAAGMLLGAEGIAGPVSPAPELVASGVPRPLQLALDGDTLVVLSPGQQTDAAGELQRVDLGGELPLDLRGRPPVRLPFPDAQTATLGSLAIDPLSRQLFLGEENGTRVFRLSANGRLDVYATGLSRLAGGSSLAFDRLARLLVVDHADRSLSLREERGPPGLEALHEEDYRGPLVFRLAADPAIPIPRRLDRLVPLYPRGWGGRTGGGLLPRFISLAALPSGDLALLASTGEVFRLTGDGALVSVARLPAGLGQYNRTNMTSAPDGSLFISGGFHVARVFRVTAAGQVQTVAENLGDPEGVALDDRGYLYLAESSRHRIIRLKVR
jgi:hypothetical protein